MLNQTNTVSANAAFWERVYNENFETLCSRACKRLTNGNSVEAEEMVSEAFVRVLRYAPDPRSMQNVLSYLWTVVRRVWTTEQMRPTIAKTDRLEDLKLQDIERLPAAQVQPEVLAILDRKDLIVELKTKLGPMSLEESKVLQLRLDGYSLEEIAAHLGEDVKRTRFRWYRFIARQRYRLKKQKARVNAVTE